MHLPARSGLSFICSSFFIRIFNSAASFKVPLDVAHTLIWSKCCHSITVAISQCCCNAANTHKRPHLHMYEQIVAHFRLCVRWVFFISLLHFSRIFFHNLLLVCLCFFFFSFAPNIQHFRSGSAVEPHTPPAFVFVHSGCSLWLYFFCQLLFCFCFFCRASSSVGVFLIKTTMQCQSHTSVRHLTRFAPPTPFNHHPTTHKPSCMRAHILFPTHPVRE